MNQDEVSCKLVMAPSYLSSFKYVLNWLRQFGLYFICLNLLELWFFFYVFDVSLSPRPHLFDQKYSNIAKYYCNLNVFLYFLNVICGKAEFSASLLQSSVLHDPSEIILICWFDGQETFPHLWKPHYGNGNFIYIALFTTTRVDQCALQ